MGAAFSLEFYRSVELAEHSAWVDLVDAAPESFRSTYGLRRQEVAGVTLVTCPGISFRLFNRALDLGLRQPVDLPALNAVLQTFSEQEVDQYYLHHSLAVAPPHLPELLTLLGMRQLSGWHRIVRFQPGAEHRFPPAHYRIVEVSPHNAAQWAAFIDEAYGFQASPWLLELVGRKGWRHAMALDGDRIEAVRSIRIHPDGAAWMGIEAPVPGIMTPNMMPDFYLCGYLVKIGLAHGVRLFVADIEKTDPGKQTEAYLNFGRLGFQTLYLRKNWGK